MMVINFINKILVKTGASEIEAAIVIPILILVALLGTDIYRALNVYQAVKRIGYEGLRLGSEFPALENSSSVDVSGNITGGPYCSEHVDRTTVTNCINDSGTYPNHQELQNKINGLILDDNELKNRIIGITTNLINETSATGVRKKINVAINTQFSFLFKTMPTDGSNWFPNGINIKKEYEAHYLRN